MHELSIALSILDLVQEESDRRGKPHIRAVHVKLGPLSGVVKEALASAFEMAREETSQPDCQLVIKEVPIVVYCSQCASERHPESIQQLCCSECGTPTPEVISGRELEVVAMEIEE